MLFMSLYFFLAQLFHLFFTSLLRAITLFYSTFFFILPFSFLVPPVFANSLFPSYFPFIVDFLFSKDSLAHKQYFDSKISFEGSGRPQEFGN
jgi:hypothetical protein